MLKPSKKIAKKEIKQDTLLTTYVQTTSWYYDNKKYVSYGLVALAAIIIGTIWFINNRNNNDEKAAIEFGKVFAIYDAAGGDMNQYKIAINGQPEKNIKGLKAIVENYSGSASAEVARLYLANAYRYTGQYDQAIKEYDNFSGSSNLLKASAHAGLGAAYEAKNEYTKAAPEYEKAASLSEEYSIPEYLSAAARAYGYAGDKEKAISLFKRLKKEYPTSNFTRDADRYIAQFSA
ncbi:MAG TPA: tetratricopeptide repeat protein [Bacteroidota bacterium]|jgi:tetratricopeptide (TPR) repeat protein|nr:tetratricopeptide repeat protein [Bacteroidota bacterium]